MNAYPVQASKEVIALDADDHLLRPTSILLYVSDMRLSLVKVDRFQTRSLLISCAA
jgi:hypothetical protein